MSTQINISTGGGGGVTSVDLTMPSAFSVAGNPIISAGTLAVTGAGSASEYIRGDGTLANFPNSTGGGASVNYYLNGGTTVATISGVTYYELNKLAAVGTPTNFNVASNDYIASFLTNPADPNKLLIPAGNWNFALYFSASTNAGSPNFYVELYKYDGTTFTLIADTSASPKDITSGTTKDLYTTIMAVPQTTLTLTDRLAVRVYVNNSGNTITLHTQGDNLCQIVTTFTTGLTALNGLTDQVQFFGASTASPIGITSAGNTHTLNIPDASQTVRGVVSTGTQTFAGSKTFSSAPTFGTMTPGSVLFAGPSGVLSQDNPNLFWDNTNDRLGIGIALPTQKLHVTGNILLSTGSDRFVRIGSSTNYWYDLQTTGDNFQVIDGGGTTRLHISYPNGNVGIGNTTPGGRLDVRALNAVAGDIGIKLRDSTNAKDLFSVSNTGVLSLNHPTFTGPALTITKTAISTFEIKAGPSNENITFGPSNRIFLNAPEISVQAGVSVGTYIAAAIGSTTGLLINNSQLSANNASRTGITLQTNSWGNVGAGGVSNLTAVKITPNINHTLGTTTGNVLLLDPTINTTGGTHTLRGLYYNPTLTMTTGVTHRAIETTTGDAIFNSTSGNVAIGGTSFGTSSSKVLAQYTGTAPTSSPASAFQMYSAVAGPALAVPHFRTETGDVIRLYKQSSVGIATVPQLIIVLQNLGLLT